jgi:hypothetical protein
MRAATSTMAARISPTARRLLRQWLDKDLTRVVRLSPSKRDPRPPDAQAKGITLIGFLEAPDYLLVSALWSIPLIRFLPEPYCFFARELSCHYDGGTADRKGGEAPLASSNRIAS